MDLKQMIAYVQIYIHIRKEKQINISIQTPRDIFLLNQAYNYAREWMTENNVKLTIL